MKRISMLLMFLLVMTLQSHHVFAQSVTITLMPDWNWISVPMMDTLDFETALGSFTPVVGDMIKSQWSNASYRADGHWRGQISQFYPGYGYKYYSNRVMPVTVTFTTQQPVLQVIVTTSEPTDITTNSATCGGNVVSSDVFVILKGICWSTNPNPTFNDNYIEVGNGIGSFSVLMTELVSGTTYYVRAFAVTTNGTFYGEQKEFTTLGVVPVGAINGKFTINANGDQVYFSQGNLQYQASTNTWRFAENQWDYVGSTIVWAGEPSGTVNGSSNHLISSTYSGWIDLFGWGTSNYNHGAVCYQPWSISGTITNYYVYGSATYNLDDQTGQADWGYNAISNGGNTENIWRTLTINEWDYIFETRITESGIRYAKANVNGVVGLILFPDDWSISNYNLNNTNNHSASFSSNQISLYDWTNMLEVHGAVFLPAAGSRSQTWVNSLGDGGCYWSSTHNDSSGANGVGFDDDRLNIPGYATRSVGQSVRLVQYAAQ